MITNMTQEDKELLFKDLSARLPYHPFAYGKRGYVCNKGRLIFVTSSGCAIMTGGGSHFHYFFNETKLYLRPMSSMTEEEYGDLCVHCSWMWHNDSKDLTKIRGDYKCYDWLNKHHFDYRGLIEKGLALEAPEGMYNIKEK